MGAAFIIAIVAGVAGLAWVVARGGLDGARFSLTVHGEGPAGIRVQGHVPGYAASEVAEFVGTLALPVGAKIKGIPDGDRVVLRMSPEVPESLHQRLRNFFYLRQ